MVDLWGPGAFGAADASATRPPYTPTNGAGDPDSFYKDCSSPAEDDGTEWKSAALNMLLVQLRQVVRKSSVSPSNLDDDLLIKAILSDHGRYVVATGSANDWVLAPAVAVPAYAVGRVLNVIPPATNTSTTVNANVSGLGNRRIKRSDGSDPAVGDLVAGKIYPTIDDGTSIRILAPLRSETATTFATAPEIEAGVVTGKAIDPAGLFSLPKSHGSDGYQMLPGGLYLQWGLVDPVGAAALTPVTFPIAFPNAAYQVTLTDRSDVVGNTDQVSVRTTGLTTTGFTIVNDESPTSVSWLAVGS